MNKEEIVRILKCDDEKEIKALFERASGIRRQVQGDKIFAYGFVYFTTYCRNNCNFCYFRRSNDIGRYRKTEEEVLALSKALVDSGVNLIDLTMGEDPLYHSEEFETVLRIIRKLKEMGTSVMISPGVVPDEIIDRFKEAGADIFALYQETHNRELFKKLRKDQDYDERMHAKLHAREEAEHAAVLTLRKKKQITKSDLVRIFDDHVKAIDKILERLDHSVDFAIMWSEHPHEGRLPDEPKDDDEEERDDGGETKTAIAYELKKHGHFREHIKQHLRALRTEIMKI